MRIGVHCSIRNGFVGAAQEAHRLGCQAFQIFARNPRGWRNRSLSDKECIEFQKACKKLKLYPVVVHSPYLPNLCSSDKLLYSRSMKAFREDLANCGRLGAKYLVIHPGSFSPDRDRKKGIKQLINALNVTIKYVRNDVKILLENVAGGGRRIGGKFSELGYVMDMVKDGGRVGLCFDTAHAVGSGYDIISKRGLKKTINRMKKYIGLNKVFVIHANDSKADIGSNRDLHQHIGMGKIGARAFKRILNVHAFKKCAVILETPKDSDTADIKNLAKLRSFVK